MVTKADPLTYRNFWEEAEAQEIGLLVRVESEDDKRLLVNALYECRKVLGQFDELMISQPTHTTIFIHHKMTELE